MGSLCSKPPTPEELEQQKNARASQEVAYRKEIEYEVRRIVTVLINYYNVGITSGYLDVWIIRNERRIIEEMKKVGLNVAFSKKSVNQGHYSSQSDYVHFALSKITDETIPNPFI